MSRRTGVRLKERRTRWVTGGARLVHDYGGELSLERRRTKWWLLITLLAPENDQKHADPYTKKRVF